MADRDMESLLIDALANSRLSEANEITRQLLVGAEHLTAEYVGRISESWCFVQGCW